MNEMDALTDISPAIQAAASTVSFYHPEYCSASLLVADLTLYVLDHGLTQDVQEIKPFGERVWWLMAFALRIVETGVAEYEQHQEGAVDVTS